MGPPGPPWDVDPIAAPPNPLLRFRAPPDPPLVEAELLVAPKPPEIVTAPPLFKFPLPAPPVTNAAPPPPLTEVPPTSEADPPLPDVAPPFPPVRLTADPSLVPLASALFRIRPPAAVPVRVVPADPSNAAVPLVTLPTVVMPPDPPHAAPESTRFPEASIWTQCPDVSTPEVVPKVVVLPDRAPDEGADPAPPPMTGRFAASAPEEAMVPDPVKARTPPEVPEPIPVPPRATARVPEEMLLALVVSVVADAASPETRATGTVPAERLPVMSTLQSVPAAAFWNTWKFPVGDVSVFLLMRSPVTLFAPSVEAI